jgi:hypothetical protein
MGARRMAGGKERGKMAGTCADGLAVGLHRKWREKNGANKGGKKENLAGKLCRRPGRRPTSRRLPPADAVVGGCLWPHHMSMCRRLGYVPSAQTGFVPTAKVCRRRPSALVVLCRRPGCADGYFAGLTASEAVPTAAVGTDSGRRHVGGFP